MKPRGFWVTFLITAGILFPTSVFLFGGFWLLTSDLAPNNALISRLFCLGLLVFVLVSFLMGYANGEELRTYKYVSFLILIRT